MQYIKRIIRTDKTDLKIIVKHEKLFCGKKTIFHEIKKKENNKYKIQDKNTSLISAKELNQAYKEAEKYFCKILKTE